MRRERLREIAENAMSNVAASPWARDVLVQYCEQALLQFAREMGEELARVPEAKHAEWAKRAYPPPRILLELAADIRAKLAELEGGRAG